MSRVLIYLLACLIIFGSCKKSDKPVPTVNTRPAEFLSGDSVRTGGLIMSDGGSIVSKRGVCWSSSLNPTTMDMKTEDGNGTGSFTSYITGIKPNVNYYLRAYAINSGGTAYGNQITVFREPSAPDILTNEATTITSTSAKIGVILNTNGSRIIKKGICFSTETHPEITDDYILNKSTHDNFVGYMTGLKMKTSYYVRSCVVYNLPSSTVDSILYGNEVSFITMAEVPTVVTGKASEVFATTAKVEGNLTSDGGEEITSFGICLSTSENPTIADTVFTAEHGSGSFVVYLTGLLPETTYNVRAFAVNSEGPGYGFNVTIYTSSGIVEDIDGNIYRTQQFGSQLWMGKNLETTKFNDGTEITACPNRFIWDSLTTAAYNTNYLSETQAYGKYYNWYTLNTGQLCPSGWHVPSADEWRVLVNTLGGNTEAGSKLMSVKMGFLGLPGGYVERGGSKQRIDQWCEWWSTSRDSTFYMENNLLKFVIIPNNENTGNTITGFQYEFAKAGQNIRCLKD